MAKSMCCKSEFDQRHQDWTIYDLHGAVLSDKININRFQSNGCLWCWVKDGKSQV